MQISTIKRVPFAGLPGLLRRIAECSDGFALLPKARLGRSTDIASGHDIHSDGKWPFIVDFSIEHGDFPLKMVSFPIEMVSMVL